MFQVIVWIQNPDKTQSDLMFLNGQIIKSTAFSERADLSKMIFDTESSAVVLYKTTDFSILQFRSKFLIKYQSSKLDENGRTMPIMVLIEDYSPELEKDLLFHINSTLNESGNFIKQEYLSVMLSKLNNERGSQLKKKSNLVLISVISLILILVLIIIINL